MLDRFLKEYKKKNVIEMTDKENNLRLILIRYPYWLAFISEGKSNIFVGIQPDLDLRTRTIKIKIEIENDNNGFQFNNNTETSIVKEYKINKKFFDTIPMELYKLVERFYDSHWDLIKSALILGKEYSDLLKSNPSFAYLITNLELINPSYRNYDQQELLNKLIRTKHVDILKLALLPYSEKMRKLFSKLDITDIPRDSLRNISRLLFNYNNTNKKIAKLISHIDQLNYNFILLIGSFYELVMDMNLNAIEELILSEDFMEKSKSLERIRLQCKSAKIRFPENIPLNNLEWFSKEIEKKVIKKIRLGYDFPEPPIEGNENIIPICSARDLRAWAKRQQNCLEDYIEKIMNNEIFIYKIKYNNEEASLEIKEKDNRWINNKLLGFKNGKPSIELILLVHQWFNKSIK